MAYRVSITSRAERDLAHLYTKINAESSGAAFRWHLGIRDTILSLEENPDRWPVTPENIELRHLLYGRKPHIYRVIYRILARQRHVEVLHIRHGARRKFKPSDLE